MLDVISGESADIVARFDEGGVARNMSPRRHASDKISIQILEDVELVVVTLNGSAFGAGETEVLLKLVRDVASGLVGPCKFIVFDFMVGSDKAKPSFEFNTLIEELSNLIFQVSVVSVAWVRQELASTDLELALACSVIVCEKGARIAFNIDLIESLRTYSLLAHRIGFVQAERLMENSSILSATEAYELMLSHSVVDAEQGVGGIRRFARSRMRRHNSACGLYRAQRIAMASSVNHV